VCVADLLTQLSLALADRYRIERELGRGGMATVYLAHDLRHDRAVALKVLQPELAATLGPERFQREIRLAARLQHPHILTVHDSGEAAGQLWFTMPFVKGESLRDRLNRERQLPVDDALRITIDAARALAYAHEHGVIHRDVKPENLLITKDGSTLVADFGIARALGGGEDHLTRTGMSVGTPAYMSPEQGAGDRHLDARTDVYSLGTVLYEMLAGEPPFTGPTAQAVLAKRVASEVPHVRRMRPSVPESVDQAVTRSLAPVPADRFPTAAEFARALQPTADTPAATPAVSSASAVGAGIPRRSARVPRRVPVAAVTLALGFLIGLGALFAWRRSHSGSAATGGKLVAVLPFENLGRPEDEYFADGMTDALRGKLSGIHGLEVIAGRSSGEYKKTTKNLTQIGHELGVDYLLVGKVRWAKGAGDTSRVQVSPELIDLTSGHAPRTRWQQPFDASITSVFHVQADIASKVASALDVALGDSTRHELAAKPTENLAAYDAYLRGQELSGGPSGSDAATLRRAAAYYEQATALDSGFALAWAQLSVAHSVLYAQGVPTPAGAEAARRAAERALALAPARAEGHHALGVYYQAVLKKNARARAEYERGLRTAPGNAELVRRLAAVEETLGRWEEALQHQGQAAVLDPRSARAASTLGETLLWLRRYPEALAAIERGLRLTPADLDMIEDKAMIYLAQGDLAAARATIRAAPKEADPSTLVTFFAQYYDLFWVLDEAQQELLLRLSPAPFDNDRAYWGLAIAGIHWVRGDQVRARTYADSARLAFEQQLKAAPEDAQRLVLHGVALAYLGRKAEAIREGERGVALSPVSKDAFNGPYFQHQLVRIYLLVGEPEKALNQLEPLLKMAYYLSPGWLKIDPTFVPLRGNPRFERLLNGT
jgi:eukaryotic-like serine/threonine-protein kinase